jgi:hypothetical protein
VVVAYVRAKTYRTRGGPDDDHTRGRDGRERVVQPRLYAGEHRGVVTYYQLVECRRVNGQPRQRVIAHLGRYSSVNDALAYMARDIRDLKQRNFSAKAIAQAERKLEHLRRLRRQGVA